MILVIPEYLVIKIFLFFLNLHIGRDGRGDGDDLLFLLPEELDLQAGITSIHGNWLKGKSPRFQRLCAVGDNIVRLATM
jgi:hypothetical protein